MSSEQQLIVSPDHDSFASTAGERLIKLVQNSLEARGSCHLSLTGGRGGTSVLAAAVAHPDSQTIDWTQVDFWWSDERFKPAGDPDRNETDARTAFFDHITTDPKKVHVMPREGEFSWGDDVDAAATAYAAELLAAGDGKPVLFDASLLGIGEDAHVASLFPGRDEQFAEQTCVSVRDSPKPPPTRTTFNMATINNSREVWLLASGAGKADALVLALGNLPAKEAPAGAARGINATYVLADEDAAAKVSH